LRLLVGKEVTFIHCISFFHIYNQDTVGDINGTVGDINGTVSDNNRYGG
jgi:hypothetical protein